MIDDIKVEIKGLEEIKKNLSELGSKLSTKFIQSSIRKGASIIKKEAQNEAKKIDDPLTKTKIYPFITAKPNKFENRKNKDKFSFRIGVKGGSKYVKTEKGKYGERKQFKQKLVNPYYWRYVEFGTVKSPGKFFMTKASKNSASKVFLEVEQNLKEQILKNKS